MLHLQREAGPQAATSDFLGLGTKNTKMVLGSVSISGPGQKCGADFIDYILTGHSRTVGCCSPRLSATKEAADDRQVSAAPQ
jgi:hypothetical protein